MFTVDPLTPLLVIENGLQSTTACEDAIPTENACGERTVHVCAAM